MAVQTCLWLNLWAYRDGRVDTITWLEMSEALSDIAEGHKGVAYHGSIKVEGNKTSELQDWSRMANEYADERHKDWKAEQIRNRSFAQEVV
jgi:hypothetical protein